MNKKILGIIIGIIAVISLIIFVSANDVSYLGINRFGGSLGQFEDVSEGWPGFSIFYDEDDVDSWLDDAPDWVQDLFGGGTRELIGAGLCRNIPAGTTGGDSNIAVGPEPGSAAAWILAEAVLDYVTPTTPRYIYKIQFYVYPGARGEAVDDEYVCQDLDFEIRMNGAAGTPLARSTLTPGAAYLFQLDEGDAAMTQLTEFGVNLLLAVSQTNANLIGQKVCIIIKEMNQPGCLWGHNQGEENEICSVIVLGEEYTYDYEELEGGWVAELTTLGGIDTDWDFETSTDPAGDTPIFSLTSTDPVTGTQTDSPIIVI